MIENAALLKSAAGQIDELDDEIKRLNDAKKDVYTHVKETVGKDEHRAWKEAVKLRQKRRVDKHSLEAFDERVGALLSMLEAPERQATPKTPPAAKSGPANGNVEESAPTRAGAPAGAEPVPHDPETGEITEPASGDGNHSPRADGETLEPGSPSTIPISSAHCPPDDSDEGVSHLRSAAGEHVSSVPPRPLAGSIDMGDIPEAFDRRKRQEVAA
jgi:uncharacterized protein (UPF0335 family)